MAWHRAARLVLLAILLAMPPAAGRADAELPPGLQPARSVLVTEIVDGDTVVLEDGTEVRLVGLQAPKLALGRQGFVEWPLAGEAHRALGVLVLGRRVTLAHGGRQVDRHGRQLGHLIRDDGLWVQGAMLEQGMARVYSFRDNRAAVAEMLAIERRARAARRGIWAHPFYAVRSPQGTFGSLDSFQLVEGIVAATAEVRRRVYLNFGENWRDDFTVSIAPGDAALFERAGMDLLALEGRRIRVRGWLYAFNGPMIDATHPEQIEVLEDE